MLTICFGDSLIKGAPTFMRGAFASCLMALSAGCVSLENEEGRLPDAMRSAISGLTAKGYPDLTKIPDAPTDLPSASTWTSLEAGLVGQGQELARNPTATAPTADETNLNWAQRERSALEADPRAQPTSALAPGAEGTPEWAKAARAKMESDLARLPPA